jgi:hypothetical protein
MPRNAHQGNNDTQKAKAKGEVELADNITSGVQEKRLQGSVEVSQSRKVGYYVSCEATTTFSWFEYVIISGSILN